MYRPFLIALLILGVSLPALGQRDEDSVFGEIIDVRVVNVEVVVTDRQGNRVPDLGPGDFRLKVDGKEVPIEFFTEVREGSAVKKGEGPQAAPGLTEGQAVGTSYLVFIDDFFPLARDRNVVLESIREASALLGPEDRMAVAAFDGRRLEMLSTWTQSKTEMDRTLARAMTRAAGSFLHRKNVELVGDAAADLDAAIVDPATGQVLDAEFSYDEVNARRYVDRMEIYLERMAAAVNGALRAFAKPPGRKVALLLSGGWPNSPVRYFLPESDGPVIDYGVDSGPRTLKTIFQTANQVGYTLYPIDIALERSSPITAANDPTGAGNSIDAPVRGLGPETELHTTLQILAAETGGRAILDQARLSALETVVSDTRSYYWLGFTPDWKGNDSNHKIKLTANPSGLKVRSREGFQDFSRETAISYQVESALLMGFLPGSQPLKVKLGPNGKEKRGRVEVPISVTIPMDQVTMIAHRGEYVAELNLRISVLDETGDRNEMPVIAVRLAGPEPPQPGQHAVYDTAVKLRAEDHDLVIALYDTASDKMLSTVEKFRYTKR